ncbi:MATH domain protein [Ancylostoma ceylanicum]|uniref:MATH domain protein n=1 Tax=Ancylostoma ceylanicum TaxID=53326 RepID=A0A0D6M603_9BILA|nr:MATH domain protein [Ancylostoma ceylanicum]
MNVKSQLRCRFQMGDMSEHEEWLEECSGRRVGRSPAGGAAGPSIQQKYKEDQVEAYFLSYFFLEAGFVIEAEKLLLRHFILFTIVCIPTLTGSRSQNVSPVLGSSGAAPAVSFSSGPPKRLFAGKFKGDLRMVIGSANASGAVPANANAASGAGASANQRGTTSDCGSEYTRSLDDIAGNSLARLENKTEGSIKLNIPNLSNLRAKVNTSFHHIANLPWRLAAKTECTKRTSHVKFFSVYIDCNPESESTLWSCDAIVEFRLLSQRPDVPHFSRQFTNKFNFNSNNWGFPSFMEWGDILNADKGYVKGDRVVVEARITVQKVVGVRKNPCFDFLSQEPHTSDAILVIDGVKLHVSKTYLSLYSPVFYALFFGKFSERDKREIPVEDVILDEFIELLNDACVRTFKSVNDIKALKLTEEYKNLSDTTKAALLEKIFKILKD